MKAEFLQNFKVGDAPLPKEIYKNASLTSDLDGAAELARQGANANELIIPMRNIL